MMFAGKLLNQVLLTVIMMVITMIVTTSLGMSSVQASPVETFEFQDEVTKVRFQALSKELRCPKCQNQNLSGSNSPIAKDLRRELHRMIEEGQDNDGIKAFMVKRYGNFVLYRPPVDKNTLLLWGSPIILFALALLFVVFLRAGQKRQAKAQPLSDAEKTQLSNLLNRYR